MLTKINKRIKRRQGFTLIELLLVVAILAVLAFLAVPAIASTIRNSRIRTCASNEIMIEQAVWRWYADEVARGVDQPFGADYTSSEDWQEWLEAYGTPGDPDATPPVPAGAGPLIAYFRPSAAPTCPFGAFEEGDGYVVLLRIGEGNILEDVLVICDNSPELHERAVGRPTEE